MKNEKKMSPRDFKIFFDGDIFWFSPERDEDKVAETHFRTFFRSKFGFWLNFIITSGLKYD